MNLNIVNKIKTISRLNPQEEVCGVIYYTKKGEVGILPCQNIAKDKYNNFEIDKTEFLATRDIGIPCGIYHSHPDETSKPTEEDTETSELLGLPFYIYGFLDNKVEEYFPKSYKLNLQGLPFIWGLFDCYTMVRNYFFQKHKRLLPDTHRADSFLDDDPKVIISNILEGGIWGDSFLNTNDRIIQVDDLLVFKSDKAYPHHLAIAVGNGRMIHQPCDRVSEVTPIRAGHLKQLKYVLRLKP